jgi:hypothetical protein
MYEKKEGGKGWIYDIKYFSRKTEPAHALKCRCQMTGYSYYFRFIPVNIGKCRDNTIKYIMAVLLHISTKTP